MTIWMGLFGSVSNRVSLAGHTDAAQFAGGDRGFSNWELSANRANASRRELVAGGMDDSKVLRVVGLASTVLFFASIVAFRYLSAVVGLTGGFASWVSQLEAVLA